MVDAKREPSGGAGGPGKEKNRGRRRRRPGGPGGPQGGAPAGQGKERGKERGPGGSSRAPKTGGAPVEKPRRPEPVEPPFKHVPKRYAVAVFETFAAARADREALASQAAGVDQLNIVIRAEGDRTDPELLAIGNVKVFAGTAWALIHDRRREEGWYDEPR